MSNIKKYGNLYYLNGLAAHGEFNYRNNTIFVKNGLPHRDPSDGPAIKKKNGTEEYYWNGKLHRWNGPAIVSKASSKLKNDYYLFGQRLNTEKDFEDVKDELLKIHDIYMNHLKHKDLLKVSIYLEQDTQDIFLFPHDDMILDSSIGFVFDFNFNNYGYETCSLAIPRSSPFGKKPSIKANLPNFIKLQHRIVTHYLPANFKDYLEFVKS